MTNHLKLCDRKNSTIKIVPLQHIARNWTVCCENSEKREVENESYWWNISYHDNDYNIYHTRKHHMLFRMTHLLQTSIQIVSLIRKSWGTEKNGCKKWWKKSETSWILYIHIVAIETTDCDTWLEFNDTIRCIYYNIFWLDHRMPSTIYRQSLDESETTRKKLAIEANCEHA